MKINKLILKNFKCYYGPCSFELATTNDKNVIVVCATSGSGKTTFMEAINWVLYGETFLEELSKIKDEKISLDLLISKPYRIELAGTGKTGEVGVEMQYEHNGEAINVINQFTFIVDSNNLVEIKTNNHILKKLPAGGNWITSPNLKVEVNKTLPESIKNYFFFDAEELSNLTKPNNQPKVQEAIFKVVGLQILIDSMSHLQEVAREYSRELGRMNLGNLTIMQKDKEDLEDKIERTKDRIISIKSEIISLKGLIDAIEHELRGLPDTNKIQSSIDKLKEDVIKLLSSRKEKEKELAKLSRELTPFILFNKLQEFNATLLKLKDKGIIPGSISINLLNEILAAEKCICSTELNKSDQHSIDCTAAIKSILNETRSQSDNKQKLLDVFNSTTFFLSSIASQNKNSLSEKTSKLDSINETIELINEEIADFEAEIAGLDNDYIQGQAKQKIKLSGELFQLNIDLGSKQTELDIDIKRFSELCDEIQKTGANNAIAAKLLRSEKIARESIFELKSIFDKFTIDARLAISENTSLHWHKMAKSTKKYSVEVDDAYSFSVKDSLGMDAMHEISKGQQEGLVLAFVTSISDVSRTFPPYIIDMPFGRVDGDFQAEIAQLLPKLCKQLILLINKGPEWNDFTKPHLIPKSNKVIELSYDEDNMKTTIN